MVRGEGEGWAVGTWSLQFSVLFISSVGTKLEDVMSKTNGSCPLAAEHKINKCSIAWERARTGEAQCTWGAQGRGVQPA